jgi:hypothetical protein
LENNFNDKTVTWDTDTIPIKDRGTLATQESLIEVYLSANEPQTLVYKFSRSTKILDAEYKPAILSEVIKMSENLHQEEQHQLLQILPKYKHLFDGILGEFNMGHISLHLKDKGCKPVVSDFRELNSLLKCHPFTYFQYQRLGT